MCVSFSLSHFATPNALTHKILLIPNGYECESKLKLNRSEDNQLNEMFGLDRKAVKWASGGVMKWKLRRQSLRCRRLISCHLFKRLFSHFYASFISRFNLYWNSTLALVVRCFSVDSSLANRVISKISHVKHVSPFISIDPLTHTPHSACRFNSNAHTDIHRTQCTTKSFKLHFYAVDLIELN